jgi:hypothetical protein
MVRISICKVFRLYQHHRVLAIVLILFVDIRCTPIYQTNTLKELIRSLSLYNDFVLYGRFKPKTSLIGSRASYLNAFIFMKHAH